MTRYEGRHQQMQGDIPNIHSTCEDGMLINQSAAMREAGDSDWGSGMSGLDDQLSRRGRSSECASVCCSSNEERCVALLLPHEVIMKVLSTRLS
ncbi:hypothetical protein R1flu_013156 [Riccia fluitans]|uniref:Uncharacterized protein n=1 Tax=Riccia fluitans TaxID=41844 RepID=A0ABD1XDN9_9MARC